MTLPETINEYSERAAAAFIQTAVFIDDKLYEKSTSRTPDKAKPTIEKTGRKWVIRVNEGIKLPSQEIDTEDDSTPDAFDIVNSFAKKQIVCSLYQPKREASVSQKSDIFPLCKASDIVIVDWNLYGDDGLKAIDLVDGLISQAVSDVPEQLRLILVYTQEANLSSVFERLRERVSNTLGGKLAQREDDDGFSFHTANSRVVVRGKPGGRYSLDVDPKFVVEEADLADVAVAEFSRLASGLLHAASLLGLAKIRENSRKILSKFNKDLDPGFLTHLSLSLPDGDASTHIVPLLVSEIESVLEDVLPDPLIPEEVLKDWVGSAWSRGPHLDKLLGDKKEIDHDRIAKDILTKGFAEARKANNAIPNLNRTNGVRRVGKIFLPSEDSTSNQRFSRLMASRTFYGDKPKSLRLGCLVQQECNKRYFLCIQPICDSVRIDGERTFVFVSLQSGDNGLSGQVLQILTEGDIFQELIYIPKAYYCIAPTFSSDKKRKEVLAKEDPQSKRLAFFTTSDIKYYWVDQLKNDHAQRTADQFANDMSRVGLTESEWLRRLSRG